MNDEEWKDIKGFEGLYQVSSSGLVRTKDRITSVANPLSDKKRLIKSHNMKLGIANTGYYRVNLTQNGIVMPMNVHRLVAEAFIPNPENKPQVNHKDLNKLNNNVSNLEWVSIRENIQHASNAGARKLRKVNQLTVDNKLIKTWPNMNRASVALSIDPNNIWLCCNNRIKQTHGFKFSFES